MAFTLNREKILNALVKLETSHKTDATPAGGTDDLRIFQTQNTFTGEVEMIDVQPMGLTNGYFTQPKRIPGMRYVRQGFQFLLFGPNTALTATPNNVISVTNGYTSIDAILKASGLRRDDTSGTATYAPILASTLDSGGGSAVTVWAQHGAQIHKTVNTYGNLQLQADAHSGILCTFEGQGLFQEPTAGTISGFTGGTHVPKAFIGVTCTITPSGGSAYTPKLDSFSLNMNNQIDLLEDCVSATGVDRCNFLDQGPTGSITLALDDDNSAALRYSGTTATSDLWKMLTSQTDLALTWALNGGTGNTWTFTAGTAQIDGPLRLGTKRKYRTVTIPLKFRHNTGGSDFTLALT